MPDAKKQEEEFSDADKVKGGNFFSFEKVGDKVTGVLVARDVRKNRLKPGTFQEVYTLVENDGKETCVAGRMLVESQGRKVAISGAAHSLPLGTYLQFKYTADKDVGQPQPAKIVEVLTRREIRKDVLDKYLGVAATETSDADIDQEEPAF